MISFKDRQQGSAKPNIYSQVLYFLKLREEVIESYSCCKINDWMTKEQFDRFFSGNKAREPSNPEILAFEKRQTLGDYNSRI